MKKNATAGTQPETKTCALYIRVSTQDQGERYSLPSQLKCFGAAREGFTVREDSIFVDTHTGKVASRPAFDQMTCRQEAWSERGVHLLGGPVRSQDRGCAAAIA